jgi:membrane associated rhomboid family serine protease
VTPTTSTERDKRYDGFLLVFAMVALMWVSEVVDTVADHRLDSYGIEPREVDGLTGVVAAPFLHGGFDHLIANTIPFLAMGFAIAFGGAVRVLAVTVIVAAVSGFGTWVVGPANTVHIGASGIVFGYATYLLSRGFFDRDLLGLAIGVAVGVIWGTALLGGLLPQEGISWQGHLFGALGGILAARVLARPREQATNASPIGARGH